jgi:FKBP-type peptidyl-prolyl cis-trans isomerase
MKSIFYILVGLFLISCNGDGEKDPNNLDSDSTSASKIEFETYIEKISYCIGLDHARGCYLTYTSAEVSDKFNIRQIELGLTDYLLGNGLRISFFEKDSLLDLYLLPNGDVDQSVVSKNDASYLVGLDEGFNMVSALVGRKIDQEIEVEFLVEGVKEGMTSTEPTMPYMDARRELSKYYSKVNLKNGSLFMKENILFEGVIETTSGLQYEVIEEGIGISPNVTDSVIIHYTGRFIDGRVFESTVPSNIAFTGSLMGVIVGWQEGVGLMKEGGLSRLYVPPTLAYGIEGKGVVEPNSTLIFDIELIDVKRFQ